MTGKKKILILHLSRLGDMIQSLPAVRLLKEDLPSCEITYLGIEDFCRLLHGIAWIDRLVTIPWQRIRALAGEFDDSRIAELSALAGEIPELGETYDVVINLTHDRAGSWLAHRVRASEKRGRLFSQKDELLIAGRWAQFLFAVARHRRETLINLVDLYTGMAGARHRPVIEFLPTSPDLDARCRETLRAATGGGRLVGFQLGASSVNRMWPLEHFAKLGRSLRADPDIRIVLFGSEREKALAERFREMAGYPVVDRVGACGLQELPSYLKALDVLVTNDTGPMHIASAVGTKVVGIFAAIAYFALTGPYGEGHIVVQSDYPCAPCLGSTACDEAPCRQAIPPETVEAAVRAILYGRNEEIADTPGARLYRTAFAADGTLGYHPLGTPGSSYAAWRQRERYQTARLSQALWNGWLGLPEQAADVPPPDGNGMTALRKTCSSYEGLYRKGEETCLKILDEYRRKKPDIRRLEASIRSLEEIDRRVREMDGPLHLLKEISGYAFADVSESLFPGLARHFLERYRGLREIVSGFETRLRPSGSLPGHGADAP